MKRKKKDGNDYLLIYRRSYSVCTVSARLYRMVKKPSVCIKYKMGYYCVVVWRMRIKIYVRSIKLLTNHAFVMKSHDVNMEFCVGG